MRSYEGELTEQTENGRQDMSRALRVTLIGIVLILASLFVLGIIVSMIGIFFVKE